MIETITKLLKSFKKIDVIHFDKMSDEVSYESIGVPVNEKHNSVEKAVVIKHKTEDEKVNSKTKIEEKPKADKKLNDKRERYIKKIHKISEEPRRKDEWVQVEIVSPDEKLESFIF